MRGLRSTAASLPLRQADLRGMGEGGDGPLPAAYTSGGPARLSSSVRSRGSTVQYVLSRRPRERGRLTKWHRGVWQYVPGGTAHAPKKPGEQARNKGRNHLKPAPGSGALQVHNLVRLRMAGVYKHHHDPARGWMFSLVEVSTVELREGQGERHDDGGARSI